jgi:protein transport protein SEC24
MRSTLNAIPATSDLLSTSGMPLGCVVCPLALPDPQDDPVLVRVG